MCQIKKVTEFQVLELDSNKCFKTAKFTSHFANCLLLLLFLVFFVVDL